MANPSAAESLSVLLISARSASRDEVAQVLDGQPGDIRLFWVPQPDLAAEYAQELAARIILVDDELGGAGQAAVIQELSSRVHGAVILALVNADGMGNAREALLAGARAFITRPLQADEIATTFRQVTVTARPALQTAKPQTSRPGRLGRLVVFCSPQDGTGRTTAAINTALCLCQLVDQPLALVDADHAAPALGIQLNLPERVDAVGPVSNGGPFDPLLLESVLVKHSSGLRVLPASALADITARMSMPELEQMLFWLKRMFPWVVVDLGLPLDQPALGFLDAADLVIMTANPEISELRNAQAMAAEFRARGYPEDKVWLLLNRYDLSGGLLDQDVEGYSGLKVRYRIPDSQIAVIDNVNQGVPFVLSSPRSPVSRAYRGFARELMSGLPLRTRSTDATGFSTSADAALAVGPAQNARGAAAPPDGHTPDEGKPGVLTEAGAALAEPEADAPMPAEAVTDGGVEPALAQTADLNMADASLSDPPVKGAAVAEGLAGREVVLSTAGGIQVPARRETTHQSAGSVRNARLMAAREWAGLICAVLAISASLGVLGLALSRVTTSWRHTTELAKFVSISPTPTGVSAAVPTAMLTRQPAGVVLVSPTPSAPTASPSPVATPSAAVPTDVSTLAATTATSAVAAAASATPAATVTIAPSATYTEAPTATFTATSTSTSTYTPQPSPTVTATPVATTRRPVASNTRVPTPTPAPTPTVTAPLLIAPAPNASQSGATVFRWQPRAALPPGTGYEVVWWNNGENPLSARGIAPPITGTVLEANLDVLAHAGQLTSNEIFWTVLIVTNDPYTRLTKPDAVVANKIFYKSGKPPPKVRSVFPMSVSWRQSP